MRFGSDTPLLEAPALIAIAVALVVFIAWLAAGTRDPDAFDVLKPAGTSMSRSTRTVYRKSYTLSLHRADSQVALPEGKKMAVPHYAIDLPMKDRNDPLSLEAAARQLSQLGGWPARRQGYGSETSIGAE